MYPQQGYPQAGPGYQQQQGYPQAGYPQAGYPQAGYPQPTGPVVNTHFGPSSRDEAARGGAGGDNMFGWSDPVGPFAEKAIRNAFVSKVYAILSIQLAFTSVLIGSFVLNPEIKVSFMRGHGSGWMLLALAVFMVSFLILACVESARRSFPLNFILLGILTLGYGLVAAITSCRYNVDVVLYAFIATAVSATLITMMAKSSSFDMTSCGTTLCILGLAHMIIGLLMCLILVPLGYAKVATLLLAVSGAFLVSMYLMYDTQLILGGRKHELSQEEYILGAIMLYVDIVQLFIYLLEIINRISDD